MHSAIEYMINIISKELYSDRDWIKCEICIPLKNGCDICSIVAVAIHLFRKTSEGVRCFSGTTTSAPDPLRLHLIFPAHPTDAWWDWIEIWMILKSNTFWMFVVFFLQCDRRPLLSAAKEGGYSVLQQCSVRWYVSTCRTKQARTPGMFHLLFKWSTCTLALPPAEPHPPTNCLLQHHWLNAVTGLCVFYNGFERSQSLLRNRTIYCKGCFCNYLFIAEGF